MRVGGDWYDVLDLGDGAVLLVIGDVMGRGVRARAAAVMGQLRAALRVYLQLGLSLPEVVVDRPGFDGGSVFPEIGRSHGLLILVEFLHAADPAGAQVRSRWSPRSAAGARRNDLDGAEHRRRMGAGGTAHRYAARWGARWWRVS